MTAADRVAYRRSILDVLLSTAALGAADAVVDDRTRLSWRQLRHQVAATAETFRRTGVAPGDRVAVCLPNEVATVVAFLAVVCSGAIWIGLDPRSPVVERQKLLDSAGVGTILGRPATVDGLRPSGSGTVIDIEGIDAALAPEGEAHLRSAPPRPDTPAVIAFTSGTTGDPRSIVHSHWNLLLPGFYRGQMDVLGARPRMGVCLPLAIGNVMALGPLFSLQTQTTCVLIDSRRAHEIADVIAQERVTTISLPPTIVLDLVRDKRVTAERIATLHHPSTGGAGCSDELKAEYRQKFGVDVARTYGLTEVPTVAAVENWDVVTPSGSSGRVLPYLYVRSVDAEGRPLPPGEIGEIWLSGATEGEWADCYTPMLGEWRAGALAPSDGGPLRTGDIGFVDTDGYISIVDRLRSLIVRGGANVSPAEVEKALHRHPGVREIAVFGVPHERLGEQVMALVCAEQGVSAADLAAFAREQLAAYKVPAEFYFTASMPRNAMLKIDRPVARRMLEQLQAVESVEGDG